MFCEVGFCFFHTLSIQVCPKKGTNPTILLWGRDWDHQTYSREGYGSLGIEHVTFLYIRGTQYPGYFSVYKGDYTIILFQLHRDLGGDFKYIFKYICTLTWGNDENATDFSIGLQPPPSTDV